MNRRNFLKNSAGILVAAPFVCNADWLMPVKTIITAGGIWEERNGIIYFTPDNSGQDGTISFYRVTDRDIELPATIDHKNGTVSFHMKFPPEPGVMKCR